MKQELQVLTHTQKAELWSHRVAECRNSNISVSAWCAQNSGRVCGFLSFEIEQKKQK